MHGAWGMGRGAWSMERGAWGMGHGAWGVERGAWVEIIIPIWIGAGFQFSDFPIVFLCPMPNQQLKTKN